MPWKKTQFSSLEEAKEVADALGLQPSCEHIRQDGIHYFTTKDGVRVAQRGDGPVLQLDAPKFVPTWVAYKEYFAGLWIEEPSIRTLKDVFTVMNRKYKVGECTHSWILHYSIKGKEEIEFRMGSDGKVYSKKSLSGSPS